MLRPVIFLVIIFLFLPISGRSQEKNQGRRPVEGEAPSGFTGGGGDASPYDTEIPPALDFDQRQAYSHRFELSPYGGDYSGDKLNHTFIVGGNFQVNLTEKLGLAADFGYSKASVDGTSALGLSFVNTNEYLIDGAFVITVPAAYRSKKGVVECDFFTSIGGGILRINNSTRGGGFIGGGMKIRPKIKWLAIRVEIRNYFTSINNPGGSNFEDDLTIRIGPTFLLPPEM